MEREPASTDCETWTEAISALADGEAPALDPRLVERHLRRCAQCRRYRAALEHGRPESAGAGRRRWPVDVSAAVVRRAGAVDRASRPRGVRLVLAVLAIQILLLAVPSLAGARDGLPAHEGRHLGAFSVAYAVGLLVVVRRPSRARTMLVVGQVLAGALLLAAAVDVVDGTISVAAEVRHLPEALSVVALWWLCEGRLPGVGSPPGRRPRPGSDPVALAGA